MTAPDTEAEGAWEALIAGNDAAGARVDQYLAARMGQETSRSRIKAMIETGQVRINELPCRPSSRIAEGDRISWRIPAPVPAAPEPEAIALSVLYEDDHLIVIDKPAGLIVHPGAGNPAGTLVNALLHHCADTLSGIGGVKRPGIVHRLDKDTSGAMVIAKTDVAHRQLAAIFADHGRSGALERHYHAMVWGTPRRMKGVIDAALGRAQNARTKRAVVAATSPDARSAKTFYSVLEQFGKKPVASLVECRLQTGRTHQIRVHMSHIGHPLIGDQTYGQGFRSKALLFEEPQRSVIAGFPRQALHAATLGFMHPVTGQEMRFLAPYPDDFEALLNALRSS